jgi:hypothetical protein
MSRTRWWVLISVLALLGVILLGGWLWTSRLQANAERLANVGKEAIALLNEYGAALEALDLDRALACYDEGYANPKEGSWIERLESDRDGVQIFLWQAGEPGIWTRDEVRAQLASLLAPVEAIELGKFKLDRVEEVLAPERAIVRAVMWLRGSRADGRVFEIQAPFRMWMAGDGEGWKITRQELLGGKTVVGGGVGFVDEADAVGLDFVAQRNPMFATEEWYPKRFGMLKYGSAGVSAADFDNDGWHDLYLADGADARLYRNTGGRFVDVTEEAGLPVGLHGVNVALFVDLDNDADKDLFLGRFTAPNRLYRNEGLDVDGRHRGFTDVSESANLGRNFVVVATAGDYDNDGDLDLYLGRYLDPRINLPTTLFYTRNSEGNSLLRNDGDLQFTDVTEEAGVRDGGLSLGVTWGDYDEDGDVDLYVANDFGRNAMLRNEGDGTFSDVSEETGTLDFGFGMSASFGDVDNDGDLDIYISNVHSGQRWYGQATTLYQYLINSLKQGTIFEDLPTYREIFSYTGADWAAYGDYFVKGNSLLLNDGGKFADVAELAGVNPFGWYWGSTFFDYDNDGRLDIYAANGWITGKSHDDL